MLDTIFQRQKINPWPVKRSSRLPAVVCDGKFSYRNGLAQVGAFAVSATDDAQCVSRNPVLVELELLVSAGGLRKVGLNLSESLKSHRTFPKRTGLSANAEFRFFPPNAVMGLRLMAAAFAGDAPGASSTSRELSKLCSYSAHRHQQAWVSLMAAELDKTISLVCSVNAMIWFETPPARWTL